MEQQHRYTNLTGAKYLDLDFSSTIPRGSIYILHIFTYICNKFRPNAGRYTYHIWVFPKNRGGPPKSSILVGVSIIFTIHFGGKIPLFLVQHPDYGPDGIRLVPHLPNTRRCVRCFFSFTSSTSPSTRSVAAACFTH